MTGVHINGIKLEAETSATDPLPTLNDIIEAAGLDPNEWRITRVESAEEAYPSSGVMSTTVQLRNHRPPIRRTPMYGEVSQLEHKPTWFDRLTGR